MSNLNGGLSGSGTLRGALGGGRVPSQDVYWDDILNKPNFATVATSGSYNDLTDKPTIPAAQVNADWNATSGVAEILNKPTIPTTASQIDYDNTTSGLQADDVQDAITELKSNLTQLDGLNVVKRITTPASVVSFSDGSNLPMYKLEIEIDNVSGCTEANVTRCGKNLAEDGFAWNINTDGIIEIITLYNTSIVSVRKNESYIQTINGVLTNIGVIAFYYERPSIGSQSYNKSRIVNLGSPIFTAPIDGYAVIRNVVADTNIQIEKGNTATTYEPHNENTYNVEFKDGSNPLTVYDGTLNIITGLLTVNDTTPPTYYNLSPISATTLTGVNNIYCDTGNILEVDYTAVINFS